MLRFVALSALALVSAAHAASQPFRLDCTVTALTDIDYFQGAIDTRGLSHVKAISDHGHTSVVVGSAAYSSEGLDLINVTTDHRRTVVTLIPYSMPYDVIDITVMKGGRGMIEISTPDMRSGKVANLRCK